MFRVSLICQIVIKVYSGIFFVLNTAYKKLIFNGYR